jgi:hypothetical protein
MPGTRGASLTDPDTSHTPIKYGFPTVEAAARFLADQL